MNPSTPRRSQGSKAFGALIASAAAMLCVTARRVEAPQVAPAVPTALATKADLARLESLAKDLSAKGRATELRELLDVIARLGEDEAAMAKLREGSLAACAKVKTPANVAALADAVRSLHTAAGELAKRLDGAEAAARRGLARQIVRLDDDAPAAHAALDESKVDGRWQTADEARMAARRREIDSALAKARRLEFEFEVGEGKCAPLAEVDPAPQHVIRFHQMTVTTTMEPAKAQRILRSVFQAFALSQFVRGKPLALPPELERSARRIVMMEHAQSYQDWIDRGLAAHRLDDARAALLRKITAFEDKNGYTVELCISEVNERAQLLVRFAQDAFSYDQQPCLAGGHMNWLSLTVFGVGIPTMVQSVDTSIGGELRTSGRRDAPEEQHFEMLAKAGVSGARRWLIYKASRGEDPAWSNSFVDQVAKLTGLDLFKSTFMIEYLQEAERFDGLFVGTAMSGTEKRTRAEVIEAKVAEGLAGLEEGFHRWLLPRVGGLAQRLAAPPQVADKLEKNEQAAWAELDRIRRSAWDNQKYREYVPSQFDRGLSDGCAAHCRYLALHPEQLSQWPGAHEEYPEKDGFTTDGCWAGMHSVIAPGATTAEDAIRGWMGTFYHRLPLIDPGLKRFGFHVGEKVAVLDAGSLVEIDEFIGCVVWPARGMRGVPTRFSPELPSPVPGSDQSTWGYPVTLQTTQSTSNYRMKLLKGAKQNGTEVPCWFSSPEHPTNPDCAPAGGFCLIPQAPLQPNTAYTVVAEPEAGETIVWSFTTG